MTNDTVEDIKSVISEKPESKEINIIEPIVKLTKTIEHTPNTISSHTSVKVSGGIKKSSGLKLPSLAEIKSGNYQIQKEEVKEIEPENLPNNQFDEFDFNQAWAKCVEIISAKNQHSLNAMISAAKPVLDLENFTATIEFNNKIQHDLFISEKPHFIGVIREMIQNYSFDFNLKINTEKEDLVPYTNVDKFKVMSTKNPALLKLRESLNLDIN